MLTLALAAACAFPATAQNGRRLWWPQGACRTTAKNHDTERRDDFPMGAGSASSAGGLLVTASQNGQSATFRQLRTTNGDGAWTIPRVSLRAIRARPHPSAIGTVGLGDSREASDGSRASYWSATNKTWVRNSADELSSGLRTLSWCIFDNTGP
jgi:hypothetical protein